MVNRASPRLLKMRFIEQWAVEHQEHPHWDKPAVERFMQELTHGKVSPIRGNEAKSLKNLSRDVRDRIKRWAATCARGLQRNTGWGNRVRTACKMFDKTKFVIFLKRLTQEEFRAYVNSLTVSYRNQSAAAALVVFVYDLIRLLDDEVCV